MRPYERRRDGQLAGTAGSYAPSFPVATSRDVPLGAAPQPWMAQAAGPPMLESPLEVGTSAAAVPAGPAPPPPMPVEPDTPSGARDVERVNQVLSPTGGKPGRVAAALAAPPIPRRPDAQNGVYVEFNDVRWFSSGPPTPLDTTRLTRVGEMRGFPVYAAADGSRSTIYIPIGRDADRVAPYSRRK
jgi:hypothetical protein